ncbi:RND family efflux transporter MFP subunit [Inhella inkyongensis]|uniref:RND family efflux transporter MFP subunit n=1 Tax=Inhella inkyongensis TaxID=392593 RepID=A0A840RY76_9BURK|nr:efflux RND transporter periplasmic adaptor subunit [Inhella inkyongensis]MBB5202905.1 RND family efflux transporter MFP subunit [Inhella inkyongensis]
MKRWLWLIAPFFVLILGIAWWQRPQPVQMVQPSRGEAIDAVFASGAIEPQAQLPVAPRVSARLLELRADEGQRVRKGELLARLETAENDAALQELAARERQAELALERAQTLVRQGFVAASEQDRARAERDAVRAQGARLRAQRGYALLTAPADGEVLRRDGEVGQFIPAGQALFVLGDAARLRVSAEVDEEDIARVRPGQPVVLRAAALGAAVFDGVVEAITPRGDPVARSYRVRIQLPQPPAGLRVGMTVDANIILARRSQALLLPSTAVHAGQVWILQGGRAKAQKVVTGTQGNGRVEVLSGLALDARVVLQAEGVKEGQRLRALP